VQGKLLGARIGAGLEESFAFEGRERRVPIACSRGRGTDASHEFRVSRVIGWRPQFRRTARFADAVGGTNRAEHRATANSHHFPFERDAGHDVPAELEPRSSFSTSGVERSNWQARQPGFTILRLTEGEGNLRACEAVARCKMVGRGSGRCADHRHEPWGLVAQPSSAESASVPFVTRRTDPAFGRPCGRRVPSGFYVERKL
jgi:hypothetical protein